jgi:hypothetical protein
VVRRVESGWFNGGTEVTGPLARSGHAIDHVAAAETAQSVVETLAGDHVGLQDVFDQGQGVDRVDECAIRSRPAVDARVGSTVASVDRVVASSMVTVTPVGRLCSDLEESTGLLQELGAARYAELLSAHRELMDSALAANRGFGVDTQGDSCFCVFRTARDAVTAAAEIQLRRPTTALPEAPAKAPAPPMIVKLALSF